MAGGPSDTTKTFYSGDNVKVVFKINPATRHLDVQPPNGEHLDVDGDHYVEVKYHEGRALFTRRPFRKPPTYEEMENVLLAAGSLHHTVVEALRLCGVKDAKPTPTPDTAEEDEPIDLGQV